MILERVLRSGVAEFKVDLAQGFQITNFVNSIDLGCTAGSSEPWTSPVREGLKLWDLVRQFLD